jgi:hypothetical protein
MNNLSLFLELLGKLALNFWPVLAFIAILTVTIITANILEAWARRRK